MDTPEKRASAGGSRLTQHEGTLKASSSRLEALECQCKTSEPRPVDSGWRRHKGHCGCVSGDTKTTEEAALGRGGTKWAPALSELPGRTRRGGGGGGGGSLGQREFTAAAPARLLSGPLVSGAGGDPQEQSGGGGQGRGRAASLEPQRADAAPASQALRASAHRERGEAPGLRARKPLPAGAGAAGARGRPPAPVRVRLPATARSPRGRRRRRRGEPGARSRRPHAPRRPPRALPAAAPGLAPGCDGTLHRARCAGPPRARAPGTWAGLPRAPAASGNAAGRGPGPAESGRGGLSGTTFLQ